eukprot:3941975-Rhodomonas_salina.4
MLAAILRKERVCSYAICLRACYAMSGTNITYRALCYAMCGTGIVCGAICLRDAMRCPVLRCS